MTDQQDPSKQSSSERDYQQKFNRIKNPFENSTSLNEQEKNGGDTGWKANVNKKNEEAQDDTKSSRKKSRFGFANRKPGKLRQGSAIVFIFSFIAIGVWYTSFFAPNILLVNIKEMYTNDLADATTALEIYTQIMFFNKIGPTAGQGCTGSQSMSAQPIECKLTTMSRAQVQTFEKHGFSFGIPIPQEVKLLIPNSDKLNFCAQKVYEDNRDDGDPRNDLPEESRYKVYCILPPEFQQHVKDAAATGFSAISNILKGNSSVSDQVSKIMDSFNPKASLSAIVKAAASNAPIVSGPQLWIYSQLSDTTKTQVYSVFNPRSSFFNDRRFTERIKTRYDMTKNVTVTGNSEKQVDCSFDSSVQQIDDGLDPLSGQVNPTNGVSLASLGYPLNIPLQVLNCPQKIKSAIQNITNPQSLLNQLTGGGGNPVDQFSSVFKTITKDPFDLNTLIDSVGGNKLPAIADIEAAGNILATNTYSYTDLMCSWYTIGNMASNALIRAKASTAARYALQYLKAADAIKAGISEEVPSNVLASKLAQSVVGGYNEALGSATDSLIYHSIVYGDSFPKNLGALGRLVEDSASIVAYNLAAYENNLTLAGSWAQVIPNAAALGAITGATGSLLPPPANVSLPGSEPLDRQYCLSGETMQNKSQIKPGDSETTKCIEAINAMAPPGYQGALAGATATASETCPEPHYDEPHRSFEGQFAMLPSQKIVQATATPYVAGWFGINTMLIAAAEQQLYTSQIKGLPANYALFSGMGELLGDMAMSRGMMPSDPINMELYLQLGEVLGVNKNQNDIARYNAKKNPFDPYNKFSFIGSLFNGLPQSVDNKAPLFATLNNILSLVGNSLGKISSLPTANAFYHSQPSLVDEGSVQATLERQASYALRLSGAFCPLDLPALSLGITPDIMCNVRYSIPLTDVALGLNLKGVIDYMTQTHADAYNAKEKELIQRIAQADPEGNKEYLSAQLAVVEAVKNKGFIDKNSGKPVKGSEYDKYLQYCVNRQDPWGTSAVASRYYEISDKEKQARLNKTFSDGTPVGNTKSPYESYINLTKNIPTMAVTATQSDRDWYTGKNCSPAGLLDSNIAQMVSYFRVYTMMCSVDGSMSGIIDCTEPDNSNGFYSDSFYLNNDILYTSWY